LSFLIFDDDDEIGGRRVLVLAVDDDGEGEEEDENENIEARRKN
jgi:hypothetical protein